MRSKNENIREIALSAAIEKGTCQCQCTNDAQNRTQQFWWEIKLRPSACWKPWFPSQGTYYNLDSNVLRHPKCRSASAHCICTHCYVHVLVHTCTRGVLAPKLSSTLDRAVLVPEEVPTACQGRFNHKIFIQNMLTSNISPPPVFP